MVASPRVAFFPDAFHEANGVARTSQALVAAAARRGRPFLCIHARPVTSTAPVGAGAPLKAARGALLEISARANLLRGGTRPPPRPSAVATRQPGAGCGSRLQGRRGPHHGAERYRAAGCVRGPSARPAAGGLLGIPTSTISPHAASRSSSGFCRAPAAATWRIGFAAAPCGRSCSSTGRLPF